jgi:hypothetical protein
MTAAVHVVLLSMCYACELYRTRGQELVQSLVCLREYTPKAASCLRYQPLQSSCSLSMTSIVLRIDMASACSGVAIGVVSMRMHNIAVTLHCAHTTQHTVPHCRLAV